MCINSYMAYTGPYNELDTCPRCSASQYFPETLTACKRFTMVPIGPVIQSFYASRDMAKHMHYLETRLDRNLNYIRCHNNQLDIYDDIACGQELLDVWSSGAFCKSDIALQISIDSAQLRADCASEAWVFVWVIHNLPPNLHYKKHFVIPGAIVPGPNKPMDIDSFLFPSLFHVAALQNEGLRIYNAHLDTYVSHLVSVVMFATADSVRCASMSGMVGHSGKFGCQLYCDMPSHHRTGDGHYYPAMKKPEDYNVSGCTHTDIQTYELDEY